MTTYIKKEPENEPIPNIARDIIGKRSWLKPKNVEAGFVYLAFVDNAYFPNFRLLAKNEKRNKRGEPTGKTFWEDELTGKRFKRKRITLVHEIPHIEELKSLSKGPK